MRSLTSNKGWFIALGETGEKNVSRSVTLHGVVFFTTFVPPDPLDPEVELSVGRPRVTASSTPLDSTMRPPSMTGPDLSAGIWERRIQKRRSRTIFRIRRSPIRRIRDRPSRGRRGHRWLRNRTHREEPFHDRCLLDAAGGLTRLSRISHLDRDEGDHLIQTSRQKDMRTKKPRLALSLAVAALLGIAAANHSLAQLSPDTP